MEIFTRTFRVRWSETNAIGQVDLAGYLRYVIETAWDWGATSGLGIAESDAMGFSWVIRETEINFYRPLRADQIFEFSIWLMNWRRVRGTRCFELRIKDDGELIADGTQQIVVLDSNSLRPTAPPKHIIDKFYIENPHIVPHQPFPKFAAHPEPHHSIKRDVKWRDLDSFEHVNNANYAAFAEDAIVGLFGDLGWSPSQFKSKNLTIVNRRFQIKYLTLAFWRDRLNVTIRLSKLNSSGGIWLIEIIREPGGESIAQCVIEWVLADSISGEEQQIPENLVQALKKKIHNKS